MQTQREVTKLLIAYTSWLLVCCLADELVSGYASAFGLVRMSKIKCGMMLAEKSSTKPPSVEKSRRCIVCAWSVNVSTGTYFYILRTGSTALATGRKLTRQLAWEIFIRDGYMYDRILEIVCMRWLR
jgi:hypothetical protein